MFGIGSFHRRLAPPLRLTVLLLLGAALSACDRVGGEATQVAVKVNDAEISLAQLRHVVQRQPAVAPERTGAQARQVLETLVDRELAAQGARNQGLDKDPSVIQEVEAAKREILARSFHDALAENAQLPSSDEIDRYYDSRPPLFAARHFYSLQETTVQGSHAELAALQPRVQASTGPSAMADLLREARMKFTVRQLTVSPEDVPLALLDKLSELREGQSLMLPQAGGARVLTMLSATPAPLGRAAARPSIQAFLANERKRQAVQEGLKLLRDRAEIEYRGTFAESASGPAGGAPTSPVR